MVKQISWSNWSKADESKYSMLHTYLKTKFNPIDEFTYIVDHKRAIMSLVENNENWKDSTKEGVNFMISKFLKLKQDLRYSKLYSQRAFEFMTGNRKKEADNKQDDKEIENYRDRQFFINVLESINYNGITTITEHFKYLLLSLLTFQPPVRSSFYTDSKFINREIDNDKVNNFIRISRRKPITVSYIINSDKVSKTKVYAMNKQLSVIEIIDKRLTDLIIDSYDKYPKTYLFEINNKPLSQPTLLKWLRDITKIDAVNVDMMRSSYINWFYEHHKSVGQREVLANQMRHSVLTAQKNYFKIFDDAEAMEKLPTDIIELQTEIYKLKENCTEDLGDVQFRKRRRDAIRTMNNGGVPREKTLVKYNIEYDNETKLYK